MTSINNGLWLCSPAPAPDTATVAVTGLGRSGTTMLARVLSELGLFMGDALTPRTHEDKRFQVLVKEKDFDGFERLCRQRDGDHDKWGFKSPALRADLAEFSARMRNPRIIVASRDLLATAIRNSIAMKSDLTETLLRSVQSYGSMIERISRCRAPVLVISYEKALQFPKDTVRAVADFCGLAPDAERLNRAAQTIENGDIRYFAGLSA